MTNEQFEILMKVLTEIKDSFKKIEKGMVEVKDNNKSLLKRTEEIQEFLNDISGDVNEISKNSSE